MPLFLFSEVEKTKAGAPKSAESIVQHAPPEPFVLHSAEVGDGLSVRLATSAATMLVSVLSFLTVSTKSEAKKGVVEEKPESETEEAVSEEAKVSSTDTETAPPPMPAGVTDFDFDGDDKADMGRWDASGTQFKVVKSSNGTFITETLGTAGSKAAPGDFDGGGLYDAVVYTPGTNSTWTGKKSENGDSISITHGTTGDVPQAGDFDDDGKTDAAVFRPSNGNWYVAKSSGGTITQGWGLTGDIPAAGDFDGDGQTDFSVFRPSNGTWYVSKSGGGGITRGWGLNGDVPVPADYTGDGKTDIAVWRPSNGTWYVATSESGYDSTWSQTWGNYGDQPVPADYDGDGRADMAVFRPKTRSWFIIKSFTSTTEMRSFGDTGDVAVPSSYLVQSGFSVDSDLLSEARLSPRNATGGTNLYSQNFSWGTSLVGLPGRSGLDMGFGIGYNSLVWTKVGTDTMVFDPDIGSMTPGFRFGFPVIEPVFMNDATDKFTYLMISPSGARVEFRQTTGASEYYETADGSYTQLQTVSSTDPNAPVDDLNIVVRTTDGTQMTYDWAYGAFRCTQIKDRNGNYITIGYDTYGNLLSVTDTLGRVVTVNYSNGLPSTITQTWKTNNGADSNTTYTWATFTYETTFDLDVDFASGTTTVIAPANGMDFPVLKKITYADTSSTEFFYNDYGQVWKIENDADDDHKLNHVRINLSAPGSDQTDCPRFTETRTWAENFNVNPADTTPTEAEQEVVVTNTAPANDTYTVSGGSAQNTSKIEVRMTGHPDELYQLIHVGRAGSWNEGLPIATRDCTGSGSTCSTEKRWTWTNWTQDNTGVAYKTNPRVIETRVGDGTNTKRTTIDYYYLAGPETYPYGLPETIKVYDTDLSTVLKTQKTTYNLSFDYTSRRIIGLPAQSELWQGTTSGTLMSKVTYAYDENGYTGTGQSLSNATQHCTSTSANCPVAYGTSFAYRGNLTSTRRWDTTAPTTESSSILSSVKYNIAGSPISQTTPWDGTQTRTVSISYADVWNDNPSPNRTTYAYPTTVTDPAGNSSTVKYRYDMGANVEALGPAPDGNDFGKKTTRTFDSLGRLSKNSVYRYASSTWTEHAYTEYEYPSNGIESKVYSTVADVDNDGNIAEDEVLTHSFFDGAGRVRASRVPHPGSANGWAAVKTEYDILGRTTRQSVPAEVDINDENDPDEWEPAGDDVAGFKWTYQKYDWMGRVVRKINTDGIDQTTLNDSDVLISYEGCGCAGGLVTTIEGELVPRTDGTSGNARRKQKIYQDILGRTFKTETFKWNGTDVYLRTEPTFNGRDQALTVVQTDFTIPNTPVTQTTTMTYNGHGRLATRRLPQQATSTSTSYNYNQDGSISSVTDSRGAVTNYTYENASGVPKRPLVTGISWTVPTESGITDPTSVSFTYDNAGNRLTMDDAFGTVDYVYNSLSQLTSETREIEALEDSFTLSYQYQIGGQLKKITDPDNVAIDYGFDKTGRLSTVAGSGSYYSGMTNYASGFAYRAWGAVKEYDYANSTGVNVTYNNRLLPSEFEITGIKANINASPHTEGGEFMYYADGRLKFSDDNRLGTHDRAFRYDQHGRMKAAYSGTEANNFINNTSIPNYNDPFLHTFNYDAFGNQNYFDGFYWDEPVADSESFENNKRIDWSYDVDGRLVSMNEPNPYEEEEWEPLTFAYDAAGRNSGSTQTFTLINESLLIEDTFEKTKTNSYDGDGRLVKTWTSTVINSGSPTETGEYFLRSSVTGDTIAELVSGTRYVYAGGQVIAQRWGGSVYWQHQNPIVGDSSSVGTNSVVSERVTLDPTGVNTGDEDPFEEPWGGEMPTTPQYLAGSLIASFFPGTGGCTAVLDGSLVGCGVLGPLFEMDAIAQCTNNDCTPQRMRVYRDGQPLYDFWSIGFQADNAGDSGQGFSGHTINGLLELINSFNLPNSNHVASLDPRDAIFGGYDPSSRCDPPLVASKDANGKTICTLPGGEIPVNVAISFDDDEEYQWDSRAWTNSNPYGSWIEWNGRPRRNIDSAELAEQIRRMTPRNSGSALQNAAFANNFCSTAFGAPQNPSTYWRGANGQFYKGPFSVSNALRVANTGTFGVGTLISAAQMASGDVSPAQGTVDIAVGALGAFGGPKGWVVAGGYFLYQNVPPPVFPQHGARAVSTNTCHGGPTIYNPRQQ